MAINKRQFLGLTLAMAVMPRRAALAAFETQSLATSRAGYVAARRYAGHFEVALLTEDGNVLHSVRLAGRGHSFAIDPLQGQVVAFARQPGTHAVTFSCKPHRFDGSVKRFHTSDGRHFSGHGVFSADGQTLYAAENDYQQGQGVIGIYQFNATSDQFERVAEWASGGIGPHEIVIDRTNNQLCVANGGLLTHPDYDKLVLNRDTMQASLTYLDLVAGKIVSRHTLPADQHKQSIRHLVLDHQQQVWFGCQYQGSRVHQLPLVGYHNGSGRLEWAQAPGSVWHAMQHYVGSIAFDPITRVVAASSPVGGVVAYWEADSKQFLALHALPDGCGVAPASEGGFVVNSGLGVWAHWRPGRATPDVLRRDDSVAWDHHLRTLYFGTEI